jgi:hypothetical protein
MLFGGELDRCSKHYCSSTLAQRSPTLAIIRLGAASQRRRSARLWGGMPDLDDYDSNAAYDIVPATFREGWWTVTGNGIPVWHAHRREDAERYATNTEHRNAMARKKLHDD